MPAKPIDLTGRRFGRWTINAYFKRSYWLCSCDCGTEKIVYGPNLVRGFTLSCGCWRDEKVSITSSTHGQSKTPEYRVWAGIKRRCLNKNDRSFRDYGGRGITICQQWSDSFESFLADMGLRPTAQHSIDRIDNAKGYEPGNCRWVTRLEQARNKTNNRIIEFQGVAKTSSEWAVITGIKRATIEYRLDSGWSIDHALTIPAEQGRNQTFKH